MDLGPYLRKIREELLASERPFSLRDVAKRINVEPSHLSNIERGKVEPTERLIVALAAELGEDSDVLLAMAGKVPADFTELLRKHPKDFALFIQKVREKPETIEQVAQQVRDGKW